MRQDVDGNTAYLCVSCERHFPRGVITMQQLCPPCVLDPKTPVQRDCAHCTREFLPVELNERGHCSTCEREVRKIEWLRETEDPTCPAPSRLK